MIKIKNAIPKFTFIFTLYYSKELNFLYYNSSDSPDFPTYFNYFKYFFLEIENTSREQGLFYYLLNSWKFYSFSDSLNSVNFFIYLHKSIQQTNFYLYLFGVLGMYYLLKHFRFSQNSIFYTLALLNFLPFIMAMRIVLKPEIIGFAMFPWVILCFEKYLIDNKLLYLYLSIPFLAICISAKGSVLVMVGLYLLIFYFFKVISVDFKKVILPIFLLALVTLGIYIEDSNANEASIIELQSGSTQTENYDFKAPKNIIYKIDIYKLLTSPKKYDHSNSTIAITLLDTFGDYFDVYWDNDASNYASERKIIFEYTESNSIKAPIFDMEQTKLTVYDQKVPDLYLREFVGLIISIVFYVFLILYIAKKNQYSKFLVAPLLALSILLVHVVTGYPVNNFDPSKGDTLKTIYYSFFLSISFIFLYAQTIENKKYKKLITLPLIIMMLFLLGFPKENSLEFSNNISNINNYSHFCNTNNLLMFQNIDDALLSKCKQSNEIQILGYGEYKDYSDFKRIPRLALTNVLVGIASILSSVFVISTFYKD